MDTSLVLARFCIEVESITIMRQKDRTMRDT